jgi:hypothetical protein
MDLRAGLDTDKRAVKTSLVTLRYRNKQNQRIKKRSAAHAAN